MSKTLLIAACAGLLSLLATLPAFQGVPGGLMLFYLASLPIYLTGFAFGLTAGTVASLSGFLAALVFGGVLVAGIFALVHLLPAWTMVRQALMRRTGPDGQTEWMPAGPILASLVGLAGGVMLITGAFLSHGSGISAFVTANLGKVLDVYAPGLPEAARESTIAMYAPFMPASVGAIWICIATASAMTAQALLVRYGRNLRPSPAYMAMRLPDWISWTFAGAVIVTVVASGDLQYAARNLALLLAVAFSFMGLTLVHAWARKRPYPAASLTLFYVLTFIAAWVVFLFTAALGALEQWAGIRHRMAGSDTGSGPADLNE